MNPNGQSTQAWFEWGTSSSLASYSPTAIQSAGSGSSAVVLNASLTGLAPGTSYYYRVAASNATGTNRGFIAAFATILPNIAPAVTTLGATNIVVDSATINGHVNPNGQATQAWFEWGIDAQLANPNSTPAQGLGSGTFALPVNDNLTGLASGATYYYRVVGTNSGGTAIGINGSFTTTFGIPQNVTASGANGSVTVVWSPTTGTASYNLYWSNSPEITKTTGNRIDNVTNPYLHGGLPIDEDFYYVVTSVGGTGVESPESAVAFAWSAAVHAPGPDVGQYFDRGIQASGAQNYDDRSSHPLRGLTTPDNTLRFGGRNCLACHNASGPARTSDECLMCHFENQPNAPAGNHRNGVIELAAITGNGLPTADCTINTIQDYDDWCLQCHGTASGITLGGISPQISRRTVLNPAAVANGRHRALNALRGGPVGCIYCHQPHGRSNTRVVRENPANRASAGAAPRRFGVYPNDTVGIYTGKYRAVANEYFPFRAQVDNTSPGVFADADDDQNYCTLACHAQKIDPTQAKEKMIKRDAATGNYLLAPGDKKAYLVGSLEYIDTDLLITFHGHVNGEVITTDDMVSDYAALKGISGPDRYKYPGTADALASNWSNTQNAASPLPFFPDLVDGTRDFTNAWNGMGMRIVYRFTCSTCHDPHGTTLQNSPGLSPGYPDLRLPKTNPDTLCHQCHR